MTTLYTITFSDDTTFEVPADGTVSVMNGGWLYVSWDWQMNSYNQERWYPPQCVRLVTLQRQVAS